MRYISVTFDLFVKEANCTNEASLQLSEVLAQPGRLIRISGLILFLAKSI